MKQEIPLICFAKPDFKLAALLAMNNITLC